MFLLYYTDGPGKAQRNKISDVWKDDLKLDDMLIAIIVGVFIIVVFLFIYFALINMENSANKTSATVSKSAPTKTKWYDEADAGWISNKFAAMPEWRDWPAWIHEDRTQLYRIRRAREENITILCYDPRFKLAKIRGTSGSVYVTSAHGCSCPDFQYNQGNMAPCKHMYRLAIRLEGNPEREIYSTDETNLDGLRILFAGRFQKTQALHAAVQERKGICEKSSLTDAQILVVGNNPSQDKVQYFEKHHLPRLNAEEILQVFDLPAVKESKTEATVEQPTEA